MEIAQYITDIKQIIMTARAKTYSAANSAMVEAYWLIGKRIVEEEQQGKQRADYGQEIIKNLSKELKNDFGKGFSERSLFQFKQFYLKFTNFEFCTQCAQNLTWSHYRLIMRLSDKNAIKYYLTEASENNWSVRTLDRNISTLYYQRLLSSQNKDIVQAEMREKTAEFQNDKFEFIKNPARLSTAKLCG
jgi:predicted nuclease of restriction endonuclease-like (RecB) superfamily